MTENKKIMILDDYENEILEAYESGKLKPSPSKTDFQSIAKNTLQKNEKSILKFPKMIFLHYREKPLVKEFLTKH